MKLESPNYRDQPNENRIRGIRGTKMPPARVAYKFL